MSAGENPTWAARDWHGLRWSAWMPLNAAHPLALAQLTQAPGFYRIRSATRPVELIHVGYAAEGVRERVERLARQVRLAVPPNDTQIPEAVGLWEVHRARSVSVQVSGAAYDVAESDADGLLRVIVAEASAWQALESVESGPK